MFSEVCRTTARSARIVWCATLIVAGCAPMASTKLPEPAAPSPALITVSNFLAGPVCGTKDHRRVCFGTQEILITNESSCIYNGKPISCTWYGYSFDYDLPVGVEKAELACKVTTNHDVDFGNPAGIVNEKAHSLDYVIALSGNRGHFFNPQYTSAADIDSVGAKSQEDEQICTYEGKTVFDFKLTMHFPEH
jgi:hypothetical protein